MSGESQREEDVSAGVWTMKAKIRPLKVCDSAHSNELNVHKMCFLCSVLAALDCVMKDINFVIIFDSPGNPEHWRNNHR